MPEHQGAPRRQRDESQRRPDEGRLADSVGTEDGNELARTDREGDVAPEHATAQLDGGAIEGDHRFEALTPS